VRSKFLGNRSRAGECDDGKIPVIIVNQAIVTDSHEQVARASGSQHNEEDYEDATGEEVYGDGVLIVGF
jgi:hypothetical protein